MTPRVVRYCLLSLLAATLVAAPACKSGPTPRPDRSDAPDQRPIEPDDADISKEFERGMEALKVGDWTRARESFRLVQSRGGDNATTDLAELYVARCDLGDLEVGAEDSQTGPRATSGNVSARLNQMAFDQTVDSRVRRAARMYAAAANAREGRLDEAYRDFDDYPDAYLGSAVLDRDRDVLWPLLIEGLWRAGRPAPALEAAGRLYQEAADLKAADQLRRFAKTRGFEAAEALPTRRLESALEEAGAFVTATAGWAYLLDRLKTGELGEAGRKEIDRFYTEVTAALTEIGAGERVSELSIRRATVGGAERLTIGAILPLSGKNKQVGNRVMQGMLLAMDAFEARVAPRVTLIFADSADPAGEVVERLQTQGASVLAGPLDSSRAEAFAEVAQKKQLPLVALTSRHPLAKTEPGSVRDQELVSGGSTNPAAQRSEGVWVFQNFMDPGAETRGVVDVAYEKLGDRRFAIAYPDIGYGSYLKDVYHRRVRQLGGSVVKSVEYKRKGSDYTQVAKQIAAAKPDAVFIPDTADKVSEITAFLADQNVWGTGESRPDDPRRTYVHYLGTTLWHEASLLRQARDYVDRPVVPAWYADAFQDQATASFGRRYNAIYGRAPENIEAFGFDTIHWIRTLMLDRGIVRSAALRDALLDGESFRGATGVARFDARGRLIRTMRFVTVGDKDGSQGFEALPYRVVPGDVTESDASTSGATR
jgi:ABC-type branched-subunit amino acid transport system substrate-binding protein